MQSFCCHVQREGDRNRGCTTICQVTATQCSVQPQHTTRLSASVHMVRPGACSKAQKFPGNGLLMCAFCCCLSAAAAAGVALAGEEVNACIDNPCTSLDYDDPAKRTLTEAYCVDKPGNDNTRKGRTCVCQQPGRSDMVAIWVDDTYNDISSFGCQYSKLHCQSHVGATTGCHSANTYDQCA